MRLLFPLLFLLRLLLKILIFVVEIYPLSHIHFLLHQSLHASLVLLDLFVFAGFCGFRDGYCGWADLSRSEKLVVDI